MNLSTFLMEMPVQTGNHLLERPKGNIVGSYFGTFFGLVLLVAWVRFCPRLKIKRFSLWFWAGLAVCVIVGPIVGGLLQ